jgi:hypothetical protein
LTHKQLTQPEPGFNLNKAKKIGALLISPIALLAGLSGLRRPGRLWRPGRAPPQSQGRP